MLKVKSMTFPIKPEDSIVFPTTLHPSVNSSATIVIKEKTTHDPKSECFKIMIDPEVHIIVLTYPTQQMWGKGKISNLGDEPIIITSIVLKLLSKMTLE